jgi:hypothetical protein
VTPHILEADFVKSGQETVNRDCVRHLNMVAAVNAFRAYDDSKVIHAAERIVDAGRLARLWAYRRRCKIRPYQ